MNDIEPKIITQCINECSPQINELLTALAKAQGEMEIAGKTSNNPFFKSKYADLPSVIEASRPYLVKNGLSVIQPIMIDNNSRRILVTILGHSSGQYIASRVYINPAKEDIQSFGSTVTYLRRYAYASIVGVVSDEDDDGEAAMRHVRNKQSEPYSNGNGSASKTITKEQQYMLNRELEIEGMEDLEKSLLNHYGISDIADMPKNKFEEIHDRILKIKKDRGIS